MGPRISIPFNRPCLLGNELVYIGRAIAEGHISGDGSFTHECQELLRKKLTVPKVLMTTSCTHALEMAGFLLDCQPGDEVIIPTFTFVSTANAFVIRGVKPVFIDVRSDTFNLDEKKLEELTTPRTKAIIPVHYAGVGCEMKAILDIAAHHDIHVVEDNAHGLFGKYEGKHLGTFGSLATQSFHETKNFTCGQGGALLINDPQFIDRAEILREKGTDRSRFDRGQVDKYTWVDVGSNYLPSDILAAFLFAQLEAMDLVQSRREAIWRYYYKHLEDWARKKNVRLPIIPENCDQSYHMFYILSPSPKQRTAMIAHLLERGILSVFHYPPLHLSSMGLRFGGRRGDCPVAEDVSDRLLRLPFYYSLTEEDQERVVDALLTLS